MPSLSTNGSVPDVATSATDISLVSVDSGILHLPLVSAGIYQAKVHPVVLLSILDHFTRRNHEGRVIGTLLGVVSEGGDVEIRNCYPVPHNEEEGKPVEIEIEFLRTMLDLHQRVNPKEIIVGWYATGNTLNNSSSLIHEFYGREIRSTLNKDLPNPIHLTVDTELNNGRLSVNAYTSANVGLTLEGPLGSMFVPVPCEVKLAEAERLGLDLIARAKDAPNRQASLLTDLDNLERSVSRVQEMLDNVQKYVDGVLNGAITPNNAVGRHLMEAISAVPKVDRAQFEQLFNNNLQDLLMVVYLSNLTRTQLAVAERLQSIL